jgi:hypothetical protein
MLGLAEGGAFQLDIRPEVLGSIPLGHTFSATHNFTLTSEKSIW